MVMMLVTYFTRHVVVEWKRVILHSEDNSNALSMNNGSMDSPV